MLLIYIIIIVYFRKYNKSLFNRVFDVNYSYFIEKHKRKTKKTIKSI